MLIKYDNKLNSNWLKKYFDNVIRYAKDNNVEIEKAILDTDLNKQKAKAFPITLYRFFKPSIQNFLDILNGELYLANPRDFNDIFDTNTGLNKDAYVKSNLLKELKKQVGTSLINENTYKQLIYLPLKTRSWSKGFLETVNEIFDLEKDLEKYKIVRNLICNINEKFECLKKRINNSNLRVSCFIGSNSDGEVINNSAMWGYYADNGRGFCVEYDIDKIKYYHNYQDAYYQEESNYEKLIELNYLKILNASLFPILYSSNRVTMPSNIINRNKLEDRDLEKYSYLSCLTKSRLWSKEKEFRLIINEDNRYIENNKIRFPFVKNVYLGPQMDMALKQSMYGMVKKLNLNIQIDEMKVSNNKFELEHTHDVLLQYDRKNNRINI